MSTIGQVLTLNGAAVDATVKILAEGLSAEQAAERFADAFPDLGSASWWLHRPGRDTPRKSKGGRRHARRLKAAKRNGIFLKGGARL
jgi:hypothetical protein